MSYVPLPNIRVTVKDQIAEGDTAALHLPGRDTHQGELLGVLPTDTQVMWTRIVLQSFPARIHPARGPPPAESGRATLN